LETHAHTCTQFVFARFLRAKMLLKTSAGSEGNGGVGGSAGDGAGECRSARKQKALTLVAEAAGPAAKHVHMAVNLEFKLHALADS